MPNLQEYNHSLTLDPFKTFKRKRLQLFISPSPSLESKRNKARVQTGKVELELRAVRISESNLLGKKEGPI